MKLQDTQINEADQIIRIMNDYKKGKKIQFRKRGSVKWLNMVAPAFDFAHYEYRSLEDMVPCCVGFNLAADMKTRLDEIVADLDTNINSLFKADVEKLVIDYILKYEPGGLFQEQRA